MAIITISRGTMSGGEALAKCISEKLGIPAVSQEILQAASDRFGISQALLLQQLEKTKGLIRGPSSERSLYLTAIQLALAERAQRGPFVYYGHAGHLLLKGLPKVLKVRVIAPLNRRAQKLAEAQHISLEEGKKTIEKTDEGRVKWTRFLYDVDWRDPSLYDLVINLDSISIESACEMIIGTLNQAEFKESPEAQTIIEDFLLASQVKTALVSHDRTKGLDLEVSAKKGTVIISGTIETGGIFPSGRHRTKNELIEVARQVDGVKEVLIELADIPVVLE
ncbi:MAG: cytidylate kinase family protein [Deltaproteobacteria bacterium]|nr:cytidylate kinase family protein [Deltaproteobacteria bacterium]